MLEKGKLGGQYLGLALTTFGVIVGALGLMLAVRKYRDPGMDVARASILPLAPPEDKPFDDRLRQRYEALEVDEATMLRLRPLMGSQPHFPEARKLLARLRSTSRSRGQSYVIDEFIASTYYYGDEPRPGLEWLAGVTRDLARDDLRYRWQYHQMIRKLASLEEPRNAEEAIEGQRRKTQRPELSRVWIAVPLWMMEALRDGGTVHGSMDALEPADREYLQQLVDEHPDEPFLDHALYFLGRYDEILATHPRSLLRDTAMRAAILRAADCGAEGGKCDVPRARQLLVQLEREFPEFTNDVAAEAGLLLAASGRLAEAESFACAGGGCAPGDRAGMLKAAIDGGKASFSEILDWLAPRDPKLLAAGLTRTFEKSDDSFELAARHDYASAYGALSASRARLKALKLKVPKALSQRLHDFEELSGWPPPRTAEEYFRLGLAEVRSARRTKSSAVGRLLRENASDTFRRVEMVGAGTPWAPKACYLRAAALRRNYEYTRANAVAEHFLRTHAGSPLYDDMLAERGLYLLNVRRDPLAAAAVFEKVARDFPRANAADNALTFLAEAQEKLYRFEDALRTYNRIATSYPRTRLGVSAVQSARMLAPVVGTRRVKPGIDGLRFSSFYGRPTVDRPAPGTHAERSGFLKDDVIVAVGDTNIGSIAAFDTTLATQPPGSRLQIHVRTPEGASRFLDVTIRNVVAYTDPDVVYEDAH